MKSPYVATLLLLAVTILPDHAAGHVVCQTSADCEEFECCAQPIPNEDNLLGECRPLQDGYKDQCYVNQPGTPAPPEGQYWRLCPCRECLVCRPRHDVQSGPVGLIEGRCLLPWEVPATP